MRLPLQVELPVELWCWLYYADQLISSDKKIFADNSQMYKMTNLFQLKFSLRLTAAKLAADLWNIFELNQYTRFTVHQNKDDIENSGAVDSHQLLEHIVWALGGFHSNNDIFSPDHNDDH